MEIENIINNVLPLFGVLIGGLITYVVQSKSIKETQKFEQKKIINEKNQRDEEIKFKAYNKVLLNDGVEPIHIWDMHHGGELDYKNYVKYVRPELYNVYHLLDKEIAKELIKIENIFARQNAWEEADEGDQESLSQSYLNIINTIKQKYKEQHELNQNVGASIHP